MERITLAHGDGGQLAHQLIANILFLCFITIVMQIRCGYVYVRPA